MMGIIVNHCDSVKLSLLFKAAFGSCKIQKPSLYRLHGDTCCESCCNRCKGIVHIVLAAHAKTYRILPYAILIQIERRPCKLIIGNRTGAVTARPVCSYRKYLSTDVFHYLLPIFNIAVNNNASLGWNLLCKKGEGAADISQILEKVQMILLNI